jgi:predicted DNA-binding antitoxin AbrB/MazE fold protein
MSHTIPAVFDDGVFRPLEPVSCPEGTRAEVIVFAQPKPPLTDAAARSAGWPTGYFEQTAGALSGEEFERPPQGDLPLREDW